MKLVPFNAIYPNLNLIASPDSFFGTVKSQFTEYQSSGFFKNSKERSLFVYSLTSRGVTHRGIVACTDIEDFNNGRVLKHENTIAPKEQKMMNLMLQNKAMVKPILLAYDKVSAIDSIIEKTIAKSAPFLEVSFEETNEMHKIWQISSPKMLKQLKDAFKNNVPKSYIADGHHRAKTCQLLNETNNKNEVIDTKLSNVLTIYFSWDQLTIYDFNRCVDAFQNYSPIKFMAELSKYCKIKSIKRAKKPIKKHQFTMNLLGEWYSLKWKKTLLEKHKKDTVLFDTHLLSEYVFKKILGIEKIKEDPRIKYIEGTIDATGMGSIIAENQNRVGFCMFPIEALDVKKISDNDKTLPPKSTWFEPRIKNGILVKGF